MAIPRTTDRTYALGDARPRIDVSPTVPTSPPGRCERCNCHLSRYRRNETLCAPCELSTGRNTEIRRKNSSRPALAARLYTEGNSWAEIAQLLGYQNARDARVSARMYLPIEDL